MSSPARPLAKCVLRWTYEQVAEVLEKLKKALLTLIDIIDAQIQALRAWLEAYDYIAKLEESAWKAIQKIVEEIRNTLLSGPEGPLAEFCPEFYDYFYGPAIEIFESAVAALTAIRNKHRGMISMVDYLDNYIGYWDRTKMELVAAIEIIDDAILIYLSNLGDQVP